MNVARLNFSHGTHSSHQQIIEKIRELNKQRQFPVAVLMDTQGPEIRTGDQEIKLVPGERITIRIFRYPWRKFWVHLLLVLIFAHIRYDIYFRFRESLVIQWKHGNKKAYTRITHSRFFSEF